MIRKIIERGQGGPDPAAMARGDTMLEMLIPGNKVGLIIGKGGETIKHLQVKLRFIFCAPFSNDLKQRLHVND